MEKKLGYCPMCGKEIFITTNVSMIHCPKCNHHINLHSYILPCQCGALPQIYQEGLAKRYIETKEMFFVEIYEYFVECEECGESASATKLHDAISVWNKMVCNRQ